MSAGAFLRILAGSREGVQVPLSPTAPLTIGRRNGELLLDDPLVSGRHCQVLRRGDDWFVQDLGSTNGTMVDGRLVRESVLKPSSELVVGSTRFSLYVTGAPDEPAERSVPRDVPPGDDAVGQQETAWLLDEELVDVAGSPERTRGNADVIGQELRLPPGMVAAVEIIAGEDQGKLVRFSRGNNHMGRRSGEIPLSDVEVSRRHAVVEVFGRDMVFLRDLGSTNGTYHNGRRMSVARLHHGDTIGVGKTVMRLDLGK
jgi:pSer/pThr/pTyr-binding forkhead associated (FHA) protein